MPLPEPSFIDRDPQVVTAELVAMYESLTGKTLYPAQPERILVDLIAYREQLLRIAIQEAAKQNLVEYAIYPMLDYLGELVGVTRLQDESDANLRERIKMAPEAFSVAGSRRAYIFWARSSHAKIVDVEVLSPAPGQVVIYPLTADGTPDAEVLEAVLTTCTGEKVRPLADQVSVVAPVSQDFTIELIVTPFVWADSVTLSAQVQAVLDDYVGGLRSSLGRDVIQSQIIGLVQSVYGVYKVLVVSPAADIIRASHQWSNCTDIVINMAEVVNG